MYFMASTLFHTHLLYSNGSGQMWSCCQKYKSSSGPQTPQKHLWKCHKITARDRKPSRINTRHPHAVPGMEGPISLPGGLKAGALSPSLGSRQHHLLPGGTAAGPSMAEGPPVPQGQHSTLVPMQHLPAGEAAQRGDPWGTQWDRGSSTFPWLCQPSPGVTGVGGPTLVLRHTW